MQEETIKKNSYYYYNRWRLNNMEKVRDLHREQKRIKNGFYKLRNLNRHIKNYSKIMHNLLLKKESIQHRIDSNKIKINNAKFNSYIKKCQIILQNQYKKLENVELKLEEVAQKLKNYMDIRDAKYKKNT